MTLKSIYQSIINIHFFPHDSKINKLQDILWHFGVSKNVGEDKYKMKRSRRVYIRKEKYQTRGQKKYDSLYYQLTP